MNIVRTQLRWSAIVLAPAALAAAAPADPAPAPEPWPPAPPAAVEAWKDLRFGMFIHWGPVSLTGHEIGWSRGAQTPIEVYDALYRKFNPTNFNADEWVAVAKTTGMKYIVLTTKHHDGFCLWDTRQTDYNIMHSPFGRDVVRELSAACRRQGLKFGTYYSVCDWYHPDFPLGSPGGKTRKPDANLPRYIEYLRAQTAELVTNYGPLCTMWFDVPQVVTAAEGVPTVQMLRRLQPDLVINNRAYRGASGDYATPEQRIGAFDLDRPWETCMTLGRQWAWKPNDQIKSRDECIQTLARTIGGDGNLLFNVGPMPDGRLEPRQVERLGEMGAWVARHADAIYATRGGPYKPGAWGACTRKGSAVYLHIFRWDGDGVVLPPLPAQIRGAKLLTADGAVDVAQTDTGLVVRVAAGLRDPTATVVRLDLDGDAMAIPPIPVAAAGDSLATGAKARASNVFRNDPRYAADKAVDDDPQSRWATDSGTRSAWIEIDLGAEKEFSKLVIREWDGDPGRIQKFAVRAKTGDGEWTTIAEGTSVAKPLAIPTTKARFLRLDIAEAREGPTLCDIAVMK